MRAAAQGLVLAMLGRKEGRIIYEACACGPRLFNNHASLVFVV